MAEEETIVITKRDLKDPHIEDMLMAQQAARRQLSPAERESVETAFWQNPVFYTAFAGLAGALTAWAICEPFVSKDALKGEGGVGLILMLILVPAFIGLGVGLIEGIMSKNFIKAIRCGGIGVGIGLVWGIVGTMIGGAAMNLIQVLGLPFFLRNAPKPNPSDPLGFLTPGVLFVLISARAMAWTIVGAGMGVGPGTALKSKKLLLNGIVGGLLGGFLGGLLFDPIGFSLTKLGYADSSSVSRMIGFGIIGLMTGMFIGLVENLTKDAWLIMKTGPLKGKQFVIYHNPTIIGSSPKCDVYIFKDPAVEPHHAEIKQVGSKFELIDKNSPQGVFVNSQRITRKFLEKGDIIIIGESLLEFQQKDKS